MEILLIIIAANSAPPLLAAFCPRTCRNRIDCGMHWRDGRDLLGSHKSRDGVMAGFLAGSACGLLLGVPLLMATAAAASSMLGDLFTSFLKRRIGLADGGDVHLIDQVFEGAFPLLLARWFYDLSWQSFMAQLLLFCAAGLAGSWISRKLLLAGPPPEALVRSPSSFREWRACHTALSPFARILNFENVIYYRWFMYGVFKLLRLYARGKKNALNVRLRRIDLKYENLPAAFQSYRILFISDLHIDGLAGLCQRLVELVRGLEVDLCLLGGDYRMEMYGNFSRANKELGRLVRHIRAADGIFGILGNHDCLEIAPALVDSRICMLINECVTIQRNGAEINIVGVDDPHYYKCHDLPKAFSEVVPGAFTVLLAHSPEIARDTPGYPIDLCLCGHTHAGQIQLPLIGPVFTHSKMPRRYASGLWRQGGMQGYTTSGAGSSGIPVRFNCPPEIVLLTLIRP